MNKGLRLATGKYVCELDSDDYLDANFAKNLCDAMDERNLDGIQCGYIGFTNDREKQVPVIEPSACGIVFYPRKLKVEYASIVFGRVVALWAGMYRRANLLVNDCYWREDVNFEDTSVIFKVRATCSRFMLWNECLYHHREDNPNSGTATITECDSIFRQFDRIFRDAHDEGLDIDGYLGVWMFYTFRWAFNRLTTDEAKVRFARIASGYFARHPGALKLFNGEEDAKKYVTIANMAPIYDL